jgi:hypothetical protein
MTFLLISVAVLAVIVVVLAAAVHEILNQLREVRGAMAIEDKPIAMDVGSSFLAREIGLRDCDARDCIAVVLSPHCGTCAAIARSFRGGAPESVWFVVIAADGGGASGALVDDLSAVGDRLIIDRDERILRKLGVEVTPLVLQFMGGSLGAAHAVSSPRQVLGLIPAEKAFKLSVGVGPREAST